MRFGRDLRPESPPHHRGRVEHWGRRLEMPLFIGADPKGWVFRADRYFTVNEVEEEERVVVALVCMEGRALGWFQWADTQDPFRSWRDVRAAVLRRFGQMGEGHRAEQLMALRQKSTVADFRDEFEARAAQIRGVPAMIFRGAFLHGLREDIRAELKMHRPNSLYDIMDLA